MDATGHRGFAALSNYTFNILYKAGKAKQDADVLSRIKWPEAMELTSHLVHAVCEGVQTPHGKIETLCNGTQAVGVLNQGNMPPGMTPLEWSQAQSKDPVLCQIIEAILQKTIGKLKIKNICLQTYLTAFLRMRKQLTLKQGMLYRKFQVSNNSRARIETTHPLELIYLDYLQIEHSKGNIDNVLIVTDHLPGMPSIPLKNTDCFSSS